MWKLWSYSPIVYRLVFMVLEFVFAKPGLWSALSK